MLPSVTEHRALLLDPDRGGGAPCLRVCDPGLTLWGRGQWEGLSCRGRGTYRRWATCSRRGWLYAHGEQHPRPREAARHPSTYQRPSRLPRGLERFHNCVVERTRMCPSHRAQTGTAPEWRRARLGSRTAHSRVSRQKCHASEGSLSAIVLGMRDFTTVLYIWDIVR